MMRGTKKAVLALAIGAVLSAFALVGYLSSRTRSLPPQGNAQRVLVLKRQHKLLLLNGNNVIKTYTVSIGRGGLAPKKQQGDHRTPEGLYEIDRRRKDNRLHLDLHISYPSKDDRERARNLDVSPGGDIMIHGMMNGFGWLGSTHRFVDWTDGCIAVTD